MLVQNKKSVSIILGFLIVLNVLAWLVVYDFSQSKFLEVNFFDVGQGDAIFIETPQRQQILIDGGPTSIILEKLGREMAFWDRTIDLIILSHPESDHLSGLLEVLKRYRVENILWTGIKRDTAGYKEWERLIKEEKANIFIAKASQEIILSNLNFNILYPLENLTGQEFKDSNNTSVVGQLVYGQNTFLFTGDIYQSAENELLGLAKQQLPANVLKISHHGSKTSNNEEFIKIVSPEIAVISVGKGNQYGHPHKETLETLAKYGITVLRTDINGDIKIISNGTAYEVSNIQN